MFQGSNSGHPAWWQELLLTEPYPWPSLSKSKRIIRGSDGDHDRGEAVTNSQLSLVSVWTPHHLWGPCYWPFSPAPVRRFHRGLWKGVFQDCASHFTRQKPQLASSQRPLEMLQEGRSTFALLVWGLAQERPGKMKNYVMPSFCFSHTLHFRNSNNAPPPVWKSHHSMNGAGWDAWFYIYPDSYHSTRPRETVAQNIHISVFLICARDAASPPFKIFVRI